MLKIILYLGLTVVGIVASMFSPLAGAITCIEAYLFNPKAIQMHDWEFRYQLATTVAFFIGLLAKRPKRLPSVGREGAILFLMWTFMAVTLFSVSWAKFAPNEAWEAGSDLFKTLLVATAFVWAIQTDANVSTIMTALAIGVLHAGLLHTYGYRLGYISSERDRDLGVLIQGQSQVMAMFIPLIIVLILIGTRWQRIIAICALPFVMNSIIKSFQRASFVGLVVDCSLLLLFLPRRMTMRLVPVFVIGAALFVFRLAPSEYWDKMATIKTPTEESSAASRLLLAQTSWRIFQDYPLGVGYKNYQYLTPRYLDASFLTDGRRSSHNSYFTVLCEMGLEGFVPWILAIGLALLSLRGIRKAAKGRPWTKLEYYAVAVEVGLYCWLAIGFFDDESNLDPAYWFLVLAVLLVRLAKSRDTVAETVVPTQLLVEAQPS